MRRCGAELLDIRTYDEVQRHGTLIAHVKCTPLYDERLSDRKDPYEAPIQQW